MFSSVVLPNGTLNDQKLYKREGIYKGMNGREVERFFLTPNESYIFKPLTNDVQMGKEAWIQDHILVNFPDFYPKILASSNSLVPEKNWLIFEDLGNLNHRFTPDLALAVTKWMIWWHQYPIKNLLHQPLHGLKPSIHEIISQIILNRTKTMAYTKILGLDASFMQSIYDLLETHSFHGALVFSHGDLHLGNYAFVGEHVMILDWENAHLNLPYWDLYHVIDLAHPLFEKQMSLELRNNILEYYFKQLNPHASLAELYSFKKNYYLFSVAFSLWMLLLIQKDLENMDGKWTKEQLEREMSETMSALLQCGGELLKE
ncbi:phosphotransferase family protein [Cytobacillus sp. Hz8]|uniref:phosphotransferase family protein n=1 Tax=Cytobacillus sp. Hz8 TaxID=3347168 RepID=UPI0035D96036